MRWCEEWPRKTREGEGQRFCPNLDNESKPTDSDYNHDRQFFRDSRVDWSAASKQRVPTLIVLGFQWIGKFLAFGTLFAMADTARR